MKIVDRYLLSSLVKPFFFCCISFFFLWIIYDLFDNLGDFIENEAPVGLVVRFYAVQLPQVAQLVLPVSYFFALLYTLTNLSYYRELQGLQAGGLSLARITWTLFTLGCGVAIVQLLLFVDASPRATERRQDTLNEIRRQPPSSEQFRQVIYRNPVSGITWFAAEVDVAKRRAFHVEILIPDTRTGEDSRKIFAAQAQYNNARWELIRCRIVSFQEDGPPRTQDLDSIDADFLTTSPHQMIAALRLPEQIPWGELHRFVFRNPHPSDVRMAPFLTQYYYRFAYPFLAPILFLFSIPLAISHDRQNRAAPLFKCLVVLFAFLIWIHFSVALGNGFRVPASLAALNPVFVFGLIGFTLFSEKVGWIWLLQLRWHQWLTPPEKEPENV